MLAKGTTQNFLLAAVRLGAREIPGRFKETLFMEWDEVGSLGQRGITLA